MRLIDLDDINWHKKIPSKQNLLAEQTRTNDVRLRATRSAFREESKRRESLRLSPGFVTNLMTGALTARVLGLVMDGTVPKQWLLVAVETGAMTLAALWLWRTGGPTT